ncbi:MAG: hypothetical protein RIC24_09260 [Hyphomicrobiales bacterium]|jgi:flavodoxin
MKSLILYYSRTGTTAKIARALQVALSAEVAQIECSRYHSGWWRYLLAGYDSVKGRLPGIDVPDITFDDYDLVILGAPIWTSYPALPLRSFLAQTPQLPTHAALFLTCGGHSPPGKAVDFVNDLLPVPLVASLAIAQKDVVDGRYSSAVHTFVAELKALQG